MYSFEGDFRRKPVQSLRGASKKVTKWLKERYFIKNTLLTFMPVSIIILIPREVKIILANNLKYRKQANFDCYQMIYIILKPQMFLNQSSVYTIKSVKHTSNSMYYISILFV